MAVNKVFIIGNISTDLELKQTQSGTSVCSFNVAVNRYSKEPDAKKVDFLTVVAWQQKAEFVSRYFKKGQAIVVVGRLENREWTDKQGNKRISTEIIAEEIDFVGSKESGDGGQPRTSVPTEPYMPTPYANGNSQNFEPFPANAGEEGLPF